MTANGGRNREIEEGRARRAEGFPPQLIRASVNDAGSTAKLERELAAKMDLFSPDLDR